MSLPPGVGTPRRQIADIRGTLRARGAELRCYIKFDVSRYISDTVMQQIHQVLQQACWHEARARIHQVLQQLQHVTSRVTAKLMYQPKDKPEAKEVEYDPKLPFFNVVSVSRVYWNILRKPC